MDCREAEDLLDSYILGALETRERERERVEAHLDGCVECGRRIQSDGELVAQLAYAVPSIEVPARVKVRLLDRIAEETASEPFGAGRPTGGNILRPLFGLGGFAAAHGGLAVAAALAVIVALGGVWFNDKLENVSDENQVLKSRLDTVEQQEVPSLASEVAQMAENESEMMDMIDKQRELAYMLATPNKSVSRLTSSTRTATADSAAQANGVIIFEGEGQSAFLTAMDLPASEDGALYRVWLIKDNVRHDAGVFNVDKTGYGQQVLIPVGSWDEIDAIEITVEPTGQSVLHGDL